VPFFVEVTNLGAGKAENVSADFKEYLGVIKNVELSAGWHFTFGDKP